MSKNPRIHTFKGEGGRVLGWHGGSVDNVPLSLALAPEDLGRRFREDRFMVAFTVVDNDTIPRIALEAFDELEAQGEVIHCEYVILDIDNPDHGRWESLAAAQAHIDEVVYGADEDSLLGSAAVYSTRGGFRLLWRLLYPVKLAQYKALVGHMMRELLEAGVDVDPCSDQPTRLMRLPNVRRDGVDLEAFVDLEPLAEPSCRLDPFQWGSLSVADMSTVGDAAVPWEELEETVLGHQHRGACRKHPWLMAGETIPPDADGHTYYSLRSVLSSVAGCGYITDPLVLLKMVEQSVSRTPERTMEEAWKMARWTATRQTNTNAQLARRESPEAPLNPEEPTPREWEALRSHSDSSSQASQTLVDRLEGGAAISERTIATRIRRDIRWLMERGLVTEVELYRHLLPSVEASANTAFSPTTLWDAVCAAVQRRRDATIENARAENMVVGFCLESPLLIALQTGSECYQLDMSRGYVNYISTHRDIIPKNHMQFTEGRIPFEPEFRVGPRQRPLGDLITEYGATVDGVERVAGLRGALYDPRVRKLKQGIYMLRDDLVAREHPEVQEWLELFGGSDVERFLDWCAALPRLDRACAALFIKGWRGSGKSMFLRGCSELWGMEGAADFKAMLADFNGAVLQSPVIAADEGIPAGGRGDVTQIFRNAVANELHDITVKYRMPSKLRSYLRIMAMANDTKDLYFKGQESDEAIDAIAQRIIYIEQDKSAPNFLKERGGRVHTESWVGKDRPGKIAQHLLWLSQTRTIAPTSDGRFLVEGVPTRFHHDMAHSQRGSSTVAVAISEELVSHLSDGVTSGAGFRIRRDVSQVDITLPAVKTIMGRRHKGRHFDVDRLRSALKGLAALTPHTKNPTVQGINATTIDFARLAETGFISLAVLHGEVGTGGYIIEE